MVNWVTKRGKAFESTGCLFKSALYKNHTWQDSILVPETALLLVSTHNRNLWPGPISWTSLRIHFIFSANQICQTWLWERAGWQEVVNYRCLVLDLSSGPDSWCSPKGAWPLGTRMGGFPCDFLKLLLISQIDWNSRTIYLRAIAGYVEEQSDIYAKSASCSKKLPWKFV